MAFYYSRYVFISNFCTRGKPGHVNKQTNFNGIFKHEMAQRSALIAFSLA